MRLTDRNTLTLAHNNDWIHIVDVSDPTDSPQGSSKKIKRSDLLNGYLGFDSRYRTIADLNGIFVGTTAQTGYNKANWDTAYGWGDHATEGYLKSFVETDPLFSISPAAGITPVHINDWNMAFSWGDHANANYQDAAQKGQPNGYAPLNGSAKIDASFLPSYVDDIIEVANFAALPSVGEAGKIYLTLDDNAMFRWGGSSYVSVGGSGTIDWVSVTGKPTTFPPSSHSHSWGQITGKPNFSTVATSGSYNDLTNKPTSFPPSSHTHNWSDITGEPNFATVAYSGSYNDLSNKPTSFPPSSHTHSEYLRNNQSGTLNAGAGTFLNITANNNSSPQLRFTKPSTGTGSGDGFQIGLDGGTNDAFLIQRENADIFIRTNNTERARFLAGGGMTIGGNLVYHKGNDGALVKLDSTSANNNHYLHTSRNHATAPVFYANNYSTGPIARFFKGTTATATSSTTRQFTINNNGGAEALVPANGWSLMGRSNANNSSGFWFSGSNDSQLIMRDDGGNTRIHLRTDGTSVFSDPVEIDNSFTVHRANGALKIKGTSNDNANIVYQLFADNDNTNIGLLGFTSSSNQDFSIHSYVSNKTLKLKQNGQLEYNGDLKLTRDAPIIYADATNGSSGLRMIINGGSSDLLRVLSGSTTRMTLENNGDLKATDFIRSSDKNLKTNIEPLNDTIDIDFFEYEMKEDLGHKRYGVIAQDVEKVAPHLVTTDSEGQKAVRYIDLLCAKVAELEREIKLLKSK